MDGVPQLLLVGAMAAVGVLHTLVCTASASGLRRVSLGPVVQYGEVLSGLVIAALGVAFWFWPVV